METDTIFDYYSETFQLPDGSYVNCEIMDTGGHEKYDALNRSYYQRADCCLLVYDITNPDSFDAIKNFYIKEIINNCKKKIKVILLGNKKDLKDQRKISHKKGIKLAEKNKFAFMETSCEINYNVADAFETLIIMTNTDMIKDGKINLDQKEEIKPFKLEDNDEDKKENNDALKISGNEELKKNASKRKNKKKINCC